jgi:GGDEF domain-containing protein
VISIGQSVTDLEKSDRLRQTTFECLVGAIRDTARYAIQIEEPASGLYQKHLEALAAETVGTDPASLAGCRSTFRGLLRDYRDKAGKFIHDLREELANGARALEEILKSLACSDGDHESRLRASMDQLREISNRPAAAGVRTALAAATDAIGTSIEELRKQHELSIAQFQMEIHMLHQRIDGLERAAMIESASRLFTRKEMEERIKAAPPEWYSLLLIRAEGLAAAEARYGESVGTEVAAAFGKRLRNSLPADAALARWGAQEFVAKVGMAKREALMASKWVAENLSGAYACLKDGKTVRPSLVVNVGVAERDPLEPPQRTCARIAEFFGKT